MDKGIMPSLNIKDSYESMDDRKIKRSRSRSRNRKSPSHRKSSTYSRSHQKHERDSSRNRSKSQSRRKNSRDRSKPSKRDKSHHHKSRDRKRDRSRKHSTERHFIRQKIIENDDKEIFRPDINKNKDNNNNLIDKPKKQSRFDVKPPGLEDSMFNNNNNLITSQQFEFELNPIKSLHARRVYVGGVGECSEADVERFFNTMIQKAANKHVPVKPVVSVFLNREKRYAFVEFNSIEITTQIMGMNGIMFQGNPLKIRRPNDFQQSMLPPENPNAPKLDLRKLGLKNLEEIREDYHTSKIIFTGVKEDMTEKDLKDIFTPMGKLLRLQIFRDPFSLKSRGYGFCEYDDPVAADLFCTEFNQIELENTILYFRKATYEHIKSLIKSDIPGEIGELEKEIDGKNKIPKQPTRILAIQNIIPYNVLGDPGLVEEYKIDMEEECKRYGRSTEFPPDVVDNIGFGVIFVEFEFIEECRQAFIQMYGRKYNERLIFCHYFDEIRYIYKDFKD